MRQEIYTKECDKPGQYSQQIDKARVHPKPVETWKRYWGLTLWHMERNRIEEQRSKKESVRREEIKLLGKIKYKEWKTMDWETA
jgi:hypothetical protein